MYRVIVLSSFLITAISAEVASPKCEKLTDSLMEFYNNHIAVSMDQSEKNQMRNFILMTHQIDVTERDSFQKIACLLIDATSLEEVADILMLPPDVVQNEYEGFIKPVERLGGPQKLRQSYELALRLLPELKKNKFPKLPITSASFDEVKAFVQGLVDDFGPDFPSLIHPYAKKIVVNDVEKFSRALIESKTIDDFTDTMGYDFTIMDVLVWFIQNQLRAFDNFNKFKTSGLAMVNFVETLDELNLLYLT